jgi:hypothetical protein
VGDIVSARVVARGVLRWHQQFPFDYGDDSRRLDRQPRIFDQNAGHRAAAVVPHFEPRIVESDEQSVQATSHRHGRQNPWKPAANGKVGVGVHHGVGQDAQVTQHDLLERSAGVHRESHSSSTALNAPCETTCIAVTRLTADPSA